MSSALPIHTFDQPPRPGVNTKPPSALRQSFTRPSIYPVSSPNSSTGYAISIQRTTADHDPNFSSTGSYIGGGNVGNGSPMSFGMSFGATGDIMRSFKGSLGRTGGGFGSFRGGGMGSFISSRIPKDDSQDPFLNGEGVSGSPMSFSSMRGLNNSFRSPNLHTRALPLNANNRAFANWKQEQFGVDKKESEFMKDFTCCGVTHRGLHELLDHYEEEHVMVVGGGEGDGGFPVVADFDDNDVEMDSFDDEEPSSSSAASTSTNSTQTSPALNHALPGLLPTFTRVGNMASGVKQMTLNDTRRPTLSTPPVSIASPREEKESAFDTFLVTSPPGSSFHSKEGVSTSFTTKSGIDGKKATLTYTKRTLPPASRAKASTQLSNAFGANVRKSDVKPATRPEIALPPSLLELRSNKTGQVIVPLVLDARGTVVQPSPSELQKAALNAPAPAPEEEEEEHDVGEPTEAALAPSQFSDYRPYRCNKPGCTKAYKQANGLKYHQSKGQCNFEENYAIAMDGLTLEEAEEKLKPFPCVVGDGCKKRYKQMNGLKYHYLTTGDHGAVGLAMLNNGTHPGPVNVPQATRPRPTHPAASRAAAIAAGARPGGWLDDAMRAHGGRPIGLPRGGNEMRGQTGGDAVLFSTADEFFQTGVTRRS
ncbi:hypothetical protein QFC24_003043 [Naganishia onofrii]|uniref:Uncharacterized protein n=1 Tax=Naganishia onofrii TaxID=1851511 RepID=A0ACC2XNT2_9TREE|nr:hypothetical protein QFC24_003043 [Naganishia onofrii]